MSLLVRNSWSPAEIRRLWDEFEEDLTPGLLTDVYETPENVIIETAVPGIKPEEIKVSITEDTLTISGELKQQEVEEGREYHQKEMHYGLFSESVELPVAVQADKVEAHFNHGMLKITLPKVEEVKPKQIEVKIQS